MAACQGQIVEATSTSSTAPTTITSIATVLSDKEIAECAAYLIFFREFIVNATEVGNPRPSIQGWIDGVVEASEAMEAALEAARAWREADEAVTLLGSPPDPMQEFIRLFHSAAQKWVDGYQEISEGIRRNDTASVNQGVSIIIDGDALWDGAIAANRCVVD